MITRGDAVKAVAALFPKEDEVGNADVYQVTCETLASAIEEISELEDTLPKIGRWIEAREYRDDGDNYVTPGGTPYYVCAACGGSGHLHGCEYPERRMFCKKCGTVNIYPWERALEELEE